jgi:hypothetical protein
VSKETYYVHDERKVDETYLVPKEIYYNFKRDAFQAGGSLS